MRVRSPRVLAAGATALVLLTGGATAAAKSVSGGYKPSTEWRTNEPALFSSGPELFAARRANDAGGPFHEECAIGVPAIGVPFGDPVEVAADYLGLSVDQVSNELEGGASLAEIASEHGKSVDGLEQALVDAAKAGLDKGVAAGEITAEQAQKLLGEVRSGIDDVVKRKGDLHGPLAKPPLGDPLKAAADYLGLSVDQLAEQLKAQKSLGDVAKAQGKSVDGLEQAIIDGAKSGLDESVAAGEMTADEEQDVLTQLRLQIDGFVNGTGALSLRAGDGRLSIRIGGPAAEVTLGGPYKTAADYLGLSVDQLTTELQAGKSLADIATEHGKSVDGLKQALVAAETAKIEKAVDGLVNQKGLPGPLCGPDVAAPGIAAPVPGLGFLGKP
jgi:hypothetical protein